MNGIPNRTYQDFYDSLFNEIKLKIITESEDFIIAQPTADLVKFYMNGALYPIELDTNKEETITHKKFIKTINSHERDRAYQREGDLKFECETIVVTIPILTNSKIDQIFKLRTNSISFDEKNYEIKDGHFVIEVEMKGYRKDLSNEQVRDIIVSAKSRIENLLTSKNGEISSENVKLEQRLTQFITERKDKLDADKKRLNELVNLVRIPLARKDGDIVKRIQVNEKPFISRIKPKTQFEDYQLDREKVVDIIKLLNSQCLQFEKTPRTYEKLTEPELRDLLLSNLNSIFQGQATGETFNNKGKTDIYLNIDKGNILITECKFYGGKKLYHETIEQLLSYLTWRQNYGIILSFCNQKNFSKVLEEAESIVKSHLSYDDGFKKLDESHYISKHVLPGDIYKYVELHHLYYNLYSEK